MLRAPGVYFERADRGPQVASVRTDVAGFVGFAAEGPLSVARPIESVRQFETEFGGLRDDLHLGWAVRGFFENGGARCWVVRAAAPEAATAATVIADSAGAPAYRIEAASAGAGGNDLAVRVTERIDAETRGTGPVEDARAVGVEDTGGFLPGDLVRLSQPGGFEAVRVLNRVEPARLRLAWAGEDAAGARLTDALLDGVDPSLPLLIARVRYQVVSVRAGVVVETVDDLGIVPGGPRDIAALLAGLPGPLVVHDLRSAVAGPPAVLAPPRGNVALAGGRDGLSTVTAQSLVDALGAFECVDEPAIFAIPDLHEPAPRPEHVLEPPVPPDPCLDCPPPEPRDAHTPEAARDTPPGFALTAIAAAQQALLAWCEARPNAFAVLDLPRAVMLGPQARASTLAWRDRFTSPFGALYMPWLAVPRPGGPAATRATPSAGHIAGAMAATDLAHGVHRAPANRRLVWAQDTLTAISETDHALLNEAGLNVIRALPGRGVRVLGARTLSSDVQWRFVPVRRLLSMIARALAVMARWSVFEPNSHATRRKLAGVFVDFLTGLWRRGSLAGAEPSEAFFVRAPIDPAGEALAARLTVEVGVAALVPLEFIVFRIGREDGAIDVTDAAGGQLQGVA